MSAELDEQTLPSTQEQPAQIPECVDTAELPDLAAQLAAVTAERDTLAADKVQFSASLLRRQADFENFRKRVERERLEFSEYAAMEAVRALLPVLDDFERALKTETADKDFAKGMELIYARLLESLKKLGLEPIESKGAKFDPNLHHAIDKVACADSAEDTVLDDYQRGFNFKGRLLRPAMVKVAVK